MFIKVNSKIKTLKKSPFNGTSNYEVCIWG